MPSEGPVHLRRAVVADAPGMARVYVAGWQAAHAGLVPDDYLACMRAKGREEFWRTELEGGSPDRKPWVALLDEEVAGFASGGLSRDEGMARGIAEVYQVYVDPDHWRHGIGSALLRHVLKDLREHGFTRADTWVVGANANARTFLEKQGWHSEGASRPEDCGGTEIDLVRYTRALR